MPQFMLVVTSVGKPVEGGESVNALKAEESTVILFDSENNITALASATMLKVALGLDGDAVMFRCEPHGIHVEGGGLAAEVLARRKLRKK